ncbi:MAG: hypothetical protein VXX85_07740 [Candidatus Margulisiibacteriota bacterium]|nr:hypothetical protein [Candidatus Margulisiibacteriota bacterium]
MSISLILGGVLFLLLVRYLFNVPVRFDDSWLDSPLTKDKSLTDSSYLLSSRVPQPDQLSQPVCVLVHGFSASTFEFEYFKEAVTNQTEDILFSTVLMGGHGRDYLAFKHSTYEDWQQPVIEEVNRLIKLGYTNISLMGVSTGATVILNSIIEKKINPLNIRQLIFIDPFLFSKNKWLYLAPYLRLFVRNTRSNASKPVEYENWHINRPISSLVQLVKLTKQVRSNLGRRHTVEDVPLFVFSSKFDSVSDTSRTNQYLKASFKRLNIQLTPSKHHVLIEPKAKSDWSSNDQHQLDGVIQKIIATINQ